MKPILGALALTTFRRSGLLFRSSLPSIHRMAASNISDSKKVRDQNVLDVPPSLDTVGFFNDLDILLPSIRPELPHFLYMPLDLREKKDHFELLMDLPGCDKNDIHLHLYKSRLTVSADRHVKEEKNQEGDRHIRRERHSHFSRSITIPDSVDKDRIDAHYENGVLTVTIPKNPNAEKGHSRTIQLK